MARQILSAFFLLALVSNTFGAALLRQLNNEVNKINELIEDGNDLRDSQRLRELGQVSRPGNNDYAPSMKRAGAALNEAAQLQQLQELLSLLKETAAERKDNLREESKSELVQVARRSLASAEQSAADFVKRNAVNLRGAKLEDGMQANANKLLIAQAPELPLTNQQLFNNLFYEALRNTLQNTIKQNPKLREDLGTDFGALLQNKKLNMPPA